MELRLTCLGTFQITLGGTALTGFPTDKLRALLIYLAVEGRLHARSELVQLFWPGYTAESANNNLRQALHRLRHLLHEDKQTPWLLTTRQSVQINPDAPIRLDVTTFTRLLAECAAHVHAQLAECPACLARLQQAVDLYSGDFLAGFTMADSDALEEWRCITQEQLHLQMIDTLTLLANAAESNGDLDSALRAAQRQVALEPGWEAAHRQIMRLLAQRGHRAAALAQYNRCRQVLAEVLGAEPDATTTALYEQIQRGDFDQKTRRVEDGKTEDRKAEDRKTEDRKTEGVGPEVITETLPPFAAPAATGRQALSAPLSSVFLSSALPISPSALYDWGEMPAVDFFTGRRAEVARVTAWLAPNGPTGEPPAQFISLLGLGGIGKTTLAAAVVKAVASTFTVVIWRSLLNAPPLGELLRNWLQTLARQTLTAPPDTLDEQLRLLLTHLGRERCLLVLDNVESIFAANEPHGRAGAARPGYEGYEQLFQRLASSEHQSCLLLTSREQPDALTRLPGGRARLRVLTLGGLDQQAGQVLLQSNGLNASAQEAAQLVDTYSGNPLALQIVAGAIADFFGGDVLAFQQAEGGLFDGIRLVLDQQFARLSPLEREILLWLAIEREAVPVATLRANLVQPVTTTRLLETLHALQNRSLLEKRDTGLTLQNVVMEYATEYLVTQIYQEMSDDKITSDDPVTLSFLNRFALLKAQAKEYVRQSQRRLLVQPLADRLQAHWGRDAVPARIKAQLANLRAAPPRKPGYAAGNLLTLLCHWQIDCRGYDFSRLCVWGVDFRGIRMSDINFAEADLAFCTFTYTLQGFAIKLQADEELLVGDLNDDHVSLWVLTGNRTFAEVHRWPCNWGGYPLVFNAPGVGDPLLLAGAGIDFAVRVWSVTEQKLLHTLRGQHDAIAAVAINAAGTLLASGAVDQMICLWDLRSGQLLQCINGEHGRVNSLAFAPSTIGQQPGDAILFSGYYDGTLQRWAITHDQMRLTWSVQTSKVHALAVAPNHALLASAHGDGSIHVWDGLSGHLLARLTGHTNHINFLIFHAHPGAGAEEPQWLASGGGDDQTVLLWAVEGDGRHQLRYRLVGHEDEVVYLSFSPDGRHLASASVERRVRLWDTQTGRPIETLLGHFDMVGALRFSPDGRWVASGSGDGLVRLWATDEQSVNQRPPRIERYLTGHVGRIQALAFSPDGRLLASAGSDQSIHLWDVQSGHLLQTLVGHTGVVLSLAFHPTLPLLASGGADHTIRLWARQGQSWGMAPNPIWLGHQARISTLAFHPAGETLVSGSDDHTIRLWDVAQGHVRTVLRGHTSSVGGVAVSADGCLIASSSFDYTLRLWQAANGDELLVRSGDRLGGHVIAIAADSELVACGVEETAIEVWNARTRQVVHTLRGHTNTVVALDFSPVAPLLISGGWDGALRLWDLRTGHCLHTLRAPGPYADMNIRGVTGISAAQKAALRALGAVEK